jgi:cysteine desulfurase/selenocysteine lyase
LWIFGPQPQYKGSVASFTLDDIHPHDVAQVLDSFGIAVRAGHHCAMPLHEKFNIPATTRASFYLYNTKAEADRLVDGLYHVKDLFG